MSLKSFFSDLCFDKHPDSFFRTFQYLPTDPEEKKSGELFLLLAIEQRADGGKEVLAREIFAKLQEKYFAQPGEDHLESFEIALRETNSLLKNFLLHEPSGTLGELNALAAVRVGHELFLAPAGLAEGWLLRKGKLVRIAEPLPLPEKEEGAADAELNANSQQPAATPETGRVNLFENVSSGEVVGGDQLVFLTKPLETRLATAAMEKLFAEARGVSFFGELQSRLEGKGEIGIAFLALEAEQEKSIEVPEAEEEDSQHPGARRKRPTWWRAALGWLAKGGKAFAGLFRGGKIGNLFSSQALRKVVVAVKDFAMELSEKIRRHADRRTLTFALIIAAVALVVGVLVLREKNSEQREIAQFQESFAALREKVAKAERLLIYDAPSARKLLLESEKSADALLGQGLFAANLEATKEQIAIDLDKVLGIERVPLDGREIVDFSAAKAGAAPVGILRLDGKLKAFDEESWFSVVLDQASAVEIEPGAGIERGLFFDDPELTVFLTDEGQLLEWDGEVATARSTEDEVWKNAVGVDDFSRYLYFLDPAENQIWKYARGADSYGRAIEYNKGADLTQAVDLAIDGNIYIATADGEILQLLRGEETEWLPQVPDGVQISSPQRLRTSFEGKSLYLLDGGERILKFEKKDGKYLGQYFFELAPGETISDFAVDEENMKILVLVGSKVFMTPIVR